MSLLSAPETMAEKVGYLLWVEAGDDADQVAATLAKRGIKGFAHTGEHCPIAMLIRREFPETDNDELWGWDEEAERSHGYFVDVDLVHTPDGPVQVPPGVQDFIEAFDNDDDGEYSALDAGADVIEAEIASIVAEAGRGAAEAARAEP